MRRWERIFDGGLYRSRQGVILGVCRGISDYFDFSLMWTRILAVIFLLVSGFWPAMGLYFIAALLMKPAPVIPIQTEAEQEFYDSYTQSRNGALFRLRRRYQKLERRIQRMEDKVTSREFDWENRLNS
jgi:phage shock protein C